MNLRSNPNLNYYRAVESLRNLSETEIETLKYAAEKLGINNPIEANANVLFHKYLESGSNHLKYKLTRHFPNETIFNINKIIKQNIDLKIGKRILSLLDFYKDHNRQNVLDTIIQHWEIFSNLNYDFMVYIAARYRIPNDKLKDEIINLLEADIKFADKEKAARDGIEKILK